MKLHTAQYIGEEGIYKRKEYTILINDAFTKVRRKCGAGEREYESKEQFEKEWINVNQL